MSKLDFQNGLAIGLASKGTASATMLDNTVTFLADGEPYEIVSVKSGNYVNAPATEPTSENGVFLNWQDSDNNTVNFPYLPKSDITLYAFITESQAERLYTFFDVDKEIYKYVFVIKRGNTMGIYFTEYCTSTVIGPKNYKTHFTNNCTYNDTFPEENNVEAVITFFITKCKMNNFLDSTDIVLQPTSEYTIWTNADIYIGNGSHNVYYLK